MTEKDIIAELIMNMITKKAAVEEINNVVQYSMIVMDAKKDYNIDELRRKYMDCREEVEDE